jgi:PAS domain S-box-containing protein
MRISDFTHPDDAEETERAIQALLEGKLERVHTEKRCIRKDGSLVSVQIIASTVRGAGGELALSIAMVEDISALKSAEAATAVAVSARESAEADTAVAVSARESAEADTAVAVSARESAEADTAVAVSGRESAEAETAVAVSGRESAEAETTVAVSARESAEADTAVAVSARESAETDTAASMEHTADLIEVAGAMIVGLDLNGDIRLFNKAAEEITGYTREELAGRNWFEVVVPRERYPAAWEEFERLLAGGQPRENEQPILTKTGEERHLVWRNTALSQRGSVAAAISIGIDVTERQRAEDELRFRNALLSTQQEASIDGILVVDGDRRIVSFNSRFAEMWGIPRDLLESGPNEPVLKAVMKLMKNPEEFERKVKHLYEARNETSRDEIALRDGRSFDRYSTSMFGQDERYYGRVWYFRDVSERNRAEADLRHERNVVAKIIETSPIGIVAFDGEGKVTFANAEAERIFGHAGGEARRNFSDFGKMTDYEGRPIPDEGRPFRQVMATGQPLYDAHLATENTDGERVYLSINAAPILTEKGESEGVIESIDDVSERRHGEETRGLLEAELLQSQKMEAVGRLAGGVAHNFNNLLTAITGYSELLLARIPTDSELHPDVEEIQRASERAAEVARQLLLFSRRGHGHRERLNLNDLIAGMEALLRQVIRSDIEIATLLANDLDRIESDRSQIEQVIVNLVVNSSDAMPGGGKLTIETANLHLAEPLVMRDLSLPAGDYVTLAVRDDGIGMDEETQARVFEPFYTTKGPDHGTGLGLSTVYAILEDHKGSILVESAPDQGTTFTIYLPSAPGQRRTSD